MIGTANIGNLQNPWQLIELHVKKKQTPWPLVRKPTIPTERSPLVGEI
jgi:hypothetical protein